ncbi:MAG TPA: hypothetical protein VGJ26_08120, partial [Pirellulales bacterium]
MLGFRLKKRERRDRQAAPRHAPRISLQRALQVSVALLSASGSLLLGMAEENNLLLAIVAIFVAAASVYLTDVKGWIRLSNNAGSIASVAALLFALFQYRRDTSDVGLLALVNFAVYVQFVLQLKAKRTSSYWLLITLSLMQVAVATALDVRLSFGILLLLYMTMAILTLTLFYLYRDSLRSQMDTASSAANQAVARPGARWPLAAQANRFAGNLAPRQTDELLARPLMWLILRCCAAAILVTAFVFYAIPRSGQMQWQ